MQNSEKIWMDGKLVDWDNAKIHVLSHGLHYGSAVFEGVRFYESPDGRPAIFRLKDHMERLLFSSEAIEMEVKYTVHDLINAAIEVVKVNKLKSGYIRPIIYYGYGKMGLNPTGAAVNIAIAAWTWGKYLGEDLIKLKTSSFMRIHPKTAKHKAKVCGHYTNSIYASQEIAKTKFDEALLLDYRGMVAEGPGENIFMIKDGKLITPKKDYIITGITRDSIMQIARDNQIEVIEKDITPEELKSADEAFLTGTAAEITPIQLIDESQIGNGKEGLISKKLKDIYLDAVSGKVELYSNWLTHV